MKNNEELIENILYIYRKKIINIVNSNKYANIELSINVKDGNISEIFNIKTNESNKMV